MREELLYDWIRKNYYGLQKPFLELKQSDIDKIKEQIKEFYQSPCPT
ncbi:MAG TPA: hypothetical protein PL110_05075 [Candidatus Eremiobacteraeota bacterium]|nr:MAG: hypothetical protein BWY64_00668 [bacterium ADurb.Bin363]HPZ07463.1 hypothetical protein [Candidatus Eremiobacteraeota bacterium]